jgi:catechol 2,3-dioxygenase-like lactoylglutathione lyase family enzyme
VSFILDAKDQADRRSREFQEDDSERYFENRTRKGQDHATVKATGINHVSIHARDIEESVNFYVSVLGMEKIPTYTFAFPTQYLRLGDLQLHVFEREGGNIEPPIFHHIGIDVDDFEGAYLKAKELGLLDTTAFFSPIYELPDGSVQLYLRDPGGNLIELDWPDVTTLDRERMGEIPKLADAVPQSPYADGATLYLRLREGG